jgi:threonine aldolase
VKEYAKIGDSLMFCLSKGLAAPVGSMLTGPQDYIDYARRVRKALGGGMRQVGILAAAGIVALTEMVDRLKEDHERAKKLAFAISEFPGVDLNPEMIQTNIVIFDFRHPDLSIPEFLARLKEQKVLVMATKGGVRFVTHKDIDDKDVDKAVEAFKKTLISS